MLKKDYFAFVFDSITKMLTSHADFFESEGLAMFRSITLILIVWFGIQSALASAEGVGGFRWGRFTTLLWEILFVYTMLAFYTVPIPGIGISFTHLILDQVSYLVDRLNQEKLQDIVQTLNVVEKTLPDPAPYELLLIIRYFIVLIAVLTAQAVALAVVIFGYVATAVFVMIGPIFIPFKLVPQMDWLFWGWFRAFVQYAFYQVVASLYVFVFGDFLVQFFGGRSTKMSSSEFVSVFPVMVLVLGVFVMGTIKIPSLTFSLFSGRSGDYVTFRWR